MHLFSLERRQRLPISVEAAWDFFSRPLNLPLITPPWLAFTVTSPLPDGMHAGMLITYRLRPLPGVSCTWVSEISHVDTPRFFVDTQRMGPYRLWHHQHFFRPVEDGVEVRDLVHYAIGYGPLDAWLNRRIVGKRLAAIFDFRREALHERFGNAAGAGSPQKTDKRN